MRTRRAVVRGGLTAAAGSLAGCLNVEEMLPEEVANAGSDESSPAERANDSPRPGATATTTAEPTGLRAVSAVGTNIDGKYVGTVRLTVEKRAETPAVDLSAIKVTWTDPGGEYRVVANTVDSSKAHGHFGIVTADGTTPAAETVIESTDERYQLVFDLGRDQATVDDPRPGVGGLASFGRRVEAGWAIDLSMTTGDGRTSETRLIVPEAVGGRNSVTLL